MATAMVTVTAAVMTAERESAKGKGQARYSKVNRRSSSVQHNNQPTTKQGRAKVVREKQTEAKRRSSGGQRSNQPITEWESANVASGMQATVTLYTIFATVTLPSSIVVSSAATLGPLLPIVVFIVDQWGQIVVIVTCYLVQDDTISTHHYNTLSTNSNYITYLSFSVQVDFDFVELK